MRFYIEWNRVSSIDCWIKLPSCFESIDDAIVALNILELSSGLATFIDRNPIDKYRIVEMYDLKEQQIITTNEN